MNKLVAKKLSKFLLETEETVSNIKIEYFIEMILSELEKIVVIICFFGYMGYLKNVLLVLMIIFLVRRYTGGSHCKSSLACLGVSIMFCGIAVLLPEFVNISPSKTVLMGISVLIMIFTSLFAPIKNETRPKLYWSDVRMIRIKGIIGVVIVDLIYFISKSDTEIKINIILTLLLIFIDIIVASIKNGTYFTMKRGEEYEEENC